MVKIEQTVTSSKFGTNDAHYTITGDNIHEIVEYCLPRIRLISKDFYRQELKESLSNKNEAFIDMHAGMGITYNVFLIEPTTSKAEKIFKVIENYFHVGDKLTFEKQVVVKLFESNLEIYFFSKGMFDTFMNQETFEKAEIGDHIELSTKNSMDTNQLNMVFVRIR